MKKEGFFEWIASYDDVKPYLKPPYLNIPREEIKALVIGNGTSTVAESLMTDLHYHEVYAIDNDDHCTQHMQTCFPQSTVHYHSYDMVDGLLSTDVDNAYLPTELRQNHYFNVIIDKGTFDAILVEGSVASMIHEVLRFLNQDGYYVLFSINKSTLLQELFSLTSLYLNIVYNDTLVFSGQTITMMICQKTQHNPSLQIDEIAHYEEIIMNAFFQMDTPFFTEVQKKDIEQKFLQSSVEGIGLKKAYEILFQGKESLGYEYSLFLEDLQSFDLKNKDKLTFEEAMQFIDTMQ